MTTIDLPESTKKRFVWLLQLLKNWPDEKITSVAISEASNWKSSLIRHDLWLIGFNKGVSNGYIVNDLIKSINDALGIESFDNLTNQSNDAAVINETLRPVEVTHRNVCIIGLGRLGAALLDQNLFGNSNFHIKAGFDPNVYRVEILRSTFPLYPASEMDFVLKRENIRYAILTVADKDAQTMANRLVKAGIKGIINMTNVVLKVPDGIKVENLSILNALNLVI